MVHRDEVPNEDNRMIPNGGILLLKVLGGNKDTISTIVVLLLNRSGKVGPVLISLGNQNAVTRKFNERVDVPYTRSRDDILGDA